MSNVPTGPISPDDRTDWPRVQSMTDADLVHDADSPATTEADWDGAVLRQGGGEIGRARTRGPQKTPVKVQVAIRFDAEVLAGLRATGKGWQTRVNEAVREWLKSHPA